MTKPVLTMSQLQFWEDDDPNRPWTITREEMWLLLDCKAKQQRGLFHFRDYEDAKRAVVQILKHNEKDGSNLYRDNAADFFLVRCCAFNYGKDTFCYTPDGDTSISYYDVLKELENEPAKDTL